MVETLTIHIQTTYWSFPVVSKKWKCRCRFLWRECVRICESNARHIGHYQLPKSGKHKSQVREVVTIKCEKTLDSDYKQDFANYILCEIQMYISKVKDQVLNL